MRREQVGDNDVVGVPLASITTFIDAHSQWALLLMFTLLLLESFGLPVPGETALIACSVLASQGALPIVWVVVVGVLAAILGDNLGYWVARKGGRPLLQRHKWTREYAARYLPASERFFKKHGGKAVFFGRFVAVLRVTAAWVAGMLLGVPVVGALAGILGGGGLGLRDTGLPNAQLRRLGADLEPRQAILCVLVSKDGLLRLREALEPYGEVFETEVEGAAP